MKHTTRRIFCLAGIAGAAVLVGCDNGASSSSAQSSAPRPMDKVNALVGTSLTLAALAEAGTGFTTGPSARPTRAVVFFDPQCPHCTALWEAAKPLESEVRLKWVPVSVLGPASLSQGATILNAADPIAKMDEHERNLKQGGRGITADSSAKSKFEREIQANTELLKVAGGSSIPFTVVSPTGPSQLIKQAGSMPTRELRRLLRLDVEVPAVVHEAPPLAEVLPTEPPAQ